ncbi:MAG: hypothetical protein ABW032_08175 [Burkholderiaceae bacterium]
MGPIRAAAVEAHAPFSEAGRQEAGDGPLHDPDVDRGGKSRERGGCRDAPLESRLRRAIARLNPDIPAAARKDA